jgi:glucose/arabinose dehydrogenase
MRKGLMVIFIVGFILIVGFAVLQSQVGNLRPALLPPSKNIVDILENKGAKKQGEAVEIPLKVPSGFQVSVFARGVGSARDLEFTPDGTLLVSDTKDGKVYALPDKNSDGKTDEVKQILSGLDNPHGLALYNGKLFVAEETQVSRYSFDEKALTATKEKTLFSLPAGGRHFTRSLAFNKKGDLFVAVGSTCDVCIERDDKLAAVVISNAEGKAPRLFSKGLRNSVFVAINPDSQELWGTEMGRDFLGDEAPPDEVNILKDGKDYGWPVCYGDRVYDKNFNERSSSYCVGTQAPVYKIAAHSAPLGLTFIDSAQFPKGEQGDLLVAYHGSWNRSTPIGYKVVRMHVEGDKVTGEEDFLTGFLGGSDALGRPVDVVFDASGNLFVSDDKAGVVYLITKK